MGQDGRTVGGYGTFSPKSENEQDGEPSESLYGHPAATRAYFVHAANELQRARSSSRTRDISGISESRNIRRNLAKTGSEAITVMDPTESNDYEETPEEQALLSESPQATYKHRRGRRSTIESNSDHSDDSDNGNPKIRSTPASHPHSHSHGSGSMNMQALILHVFGDALGNVGVIATGLVIWLTSWSWRFYCDPVISLVITVIIFSSALPLGMSSITVCTFTGNIKF